MLQIGFGHDFRWEPDLRVRGGGQAQQTHPAPHAPRRPQSAPHIHNAATFPVVRDLSCFDVFARYLYSLGCRRLLTST